MFTLTPLMPCRRFCRCVYMPLSCLIWLRFSLLYRIDATYATCYYAAMLLFFVTLPPAAYSPCCASAYADVSACAMLRHDAADVIIDALPLLSYAYAAYAMRATCHAVATLFIVAIATLIADFFRCCFAATLYYACAIFF